MPGDFPDFVVMPEESIVEFVVFPGSGAAGNGFLFAWIFVEAKHLGWILLGLGLGLYRAPVLGRSWWRRKLVRSAAAAALLPRVPRATRWSQHHRLHHHLAEQPLTWAAHSRRLLSRAATRRPRCGGGVPLCGAHLYAECLLLLTLCPAQGTRPLLALLTLLALAAVAALAALAPCVALRGEAARRRGGEAARRGERGRRGSLTHSLMSEYPRGVAKESLIRDGLSLPLQTGPPLLLQPAGVGGEGG